MLVLRDIHKQYGSLQVLRGIDLELAAGSLVALLGKSGAGKTTLLQVIGTLDRPDRGQVLFDGQDVLRLPERQLDAFRNRTLGFVFQFHHLMAEFTAVENVAMPAYIAGRSRTEAERRARELLAELDLGHRLDHRPAQLSGGEAQRVAVARALINEPRLILADEPTGNLDSANGDALFQLFRRLATERGVSLLVATHNEAFGQLADRTVRMQDGRMLAAAPLGQATTA